MFYAIIDIYCPIQMFNERYFKIYLILYAGWVCPSVLPSDPTSEVFEGSRVLYDHHWASLIPPKCLFFSQFWRSDTFKTSPTNSIKDSHYMRLCLMKIAENPFGPTTEQECRQKKFITWQLLNVQNWICDYNIHQPHLNQTEKKKHKASRTRYKHAIFETTNIPSVQDSFVALRYLDWHVQRMQ